MKRILLASSVALSVALVGGGYYIYQHRDPLQQAKVLLSKGDFRAAGLQLRTAVRDSPSSAEAHALLAQYYLASDDAIAAEHEIQQARHLKWDEPASMALLSQSYMRQGKWAEILSTIPEKGSSPEQTAYYMMARAVAERGLKHNEQSVKMLDDAERLAPQNAEIHIVAGRFAQQDGHLDQALDEVNRALALEPSRTDALQFKSHLLIARGDQAGALAELTRAIDAAPARLDLLVERAALLLTMNEDAKAKADVTTILAKDAGNVAARFVNGVLLVRENKFADADVEFQRIDPFLERFQRGLYFKALVKSRLGLFGQAEDAIMSYMNHAGADPDGVRLLAQIELATKHATRAVPYLVKAVEAGQRDAETLDLLGRAYAMSGEPQKAEATLQQASEMARKPGELTRLASARLQMGDLSGAASDLQRSLSITPAQPGAAEALIATAIKLGQLDRAQDALNQLQQQAGNTEAVGNLTGLLKLAQFDPNGALTVFEDTSKRFPDAIAPRLNQAKVLAQLNRPNDALPLLKAILDRSPAQPETLTLYAQLLLQQGRAPEALAAADRAHKTDPGNLGLVNGEAQLYSRMQRYPEALALLDSAKVADKTPAPLLPTLGSVQLAAGQVDAAKRTFADLAAAEPDNLAATVANSDVLIRLKDFAGARSALDLALQKHPTNLALLQARVRVDLLDGGLDSALQTSDRLSGDQTHMPAAASLKGGLLMGAQRPKDAVAAFRTEFQRAPSPVLVVALAQAMNASGDASGASTELLRWQGAHPDDPAVAQQLGTLDITAQRYDAAERNLQLALKAQPADLVALNNLAWLYQRKGDRRAREYAQRAFEQAPTPEVTDTLAWIMAQQGEAAKALPLLKAASAGRPQNATIKYHLAVAMKDTGDRTGAAETLRSVLGNSEPFDDRPAAQALLNDLAKATP